MCKNNKNCSLLHRYYKWRMENIKCCWMMRTSIPIFFILLLFLNLCLATLTLATPAHYTTTAASHYDIDATTSIDISYAPTEEDGDTFIHEPPSVFDPTKPTPLSFIKVIFFIHMAYIDCRLQCSLFSVLQNAKCKLHKENGKTIPRRCGLRELDLPGNESGVEYWNPQICRSAHCQCMATKEIRKKEKRSIANNKTIIEYRRFKVFECV